MREPLKEGRWVKMATSKKITSKHHANQKNNPHMQKINQNIFEILQESRDNFREAEQLSEE